MTVNNTKKIISYIKILLTLFVMFFSIICFSACDESGNTRVVGVTIIPQQTFVKKVAGDLVDVVTLVPTGSSPETFEPLPKDLVKLDSAVLYFTIGVPTEGDNILGNINSNTKIVHLEQVCSEKYNDIYFASGGRDPHIWLSPKRVIAMVEVIRDELIRVDSLHQDVYTDNANEFINELKKADEEIKDAIEKSGVKDFIAYHPAFGYFASDYNLKMHSLEQDGKEATIETFTKLVDEAKELNIKVIVYQEEVDGSQAEAFAEEINGKAIKLEPLSSDYIDNLYKMAKVISEIKNE